MCRCCYRLGVVIGVGMVGVVVGGWCLVSVVLKCVKKFFVSFCVVRLMRWELIWVSLLLMLVVIL